MLVLHGIELLPSWRAFLSFALAGLLLNLVPGQDMLFVIMTAARSRRAGIVAALGIGAGAFVHILAAAAGVSAIIAASEQAFRILKLVGVCYLLWLAVLMLRAAGPAAGPAAPAALGDWQLFRRAALVNVTNPKVALFFLAFLPQFVSARASVPVLEILCLGIWFDAVGTLVNVMVAVTAHSLSTRASRIEWLRSLGRRFASGALILIAARLAFAERR